MGFSVTEAKILYSSSSSTLNTDSGYVYKVGKKDGSVSEVHPKHYRSYKDLLIAYFNTNSIEVKLFNN